MRLKSQGEKYNVQHPSVSAHNLIIGDLYLDLFGTMKARCLTTGVSCEFSCLQ